jgi:hypothetical protein
MLLSMERCFGSWSGHFPPTTGAVRAGGNQSHTAAPADIYPMAVGYFVGIVGSSDINFRRLAGAWNLSTSLKIREGAILRDAPSMALS